MNDCLICYGSNMDMIFLDCLHSMCRMCVKKLQTNVCPFCRFPFIKKDVLQIEKPKYEKDFYRIRIKNRKGRHHTFTETIDFDSELIYIEIPAYKKKHNWNIKNAKNRGSILNLYR